MPGGVSSSFYFSVICEFVCEESAECLDDLTFLRTRSKSWSRDTKYG